MPIKKPAKYEARNIRDWLVMAEAGTVSVEQARQVSALTGGVPTNRPLQPLGGREIARTMSAEFQR